MADEPNLLPGAPPADAELSVSTELPPPLQPPARAPVENPVWNGGDVVAIFTVFFFSVFLFPTVAAVIVLLRSGGQKINPAELGHNPLIVLPAQCAAYAVVVLLMYLVLRNHGVGFLSGIGWNFPRRLKSAAGLVATGVVLAFFIQGTSSLLPVPKSLPIEEFFRNATGAWLMAASAIIMAPIAEELLFRAFLYPSLARSLGMIGAVLLTSLGFASLHALQLAFAWAPLLMVFIVGLVLTITRARTRSVAAGWIIHSAYNATLFLMMYIGTDHFRHLERMRS